MAATDILTNVLGTLNGLRPADPRAARPAEQDDRSNDWSQSRGHRAQGEDDGTE
jgi:hypothetical protein